MCVNNKRIVNRIFKVLCVYEQDAEYYPEYLDTIIVELFGYSQDIHFTEIQRQLFYEAGTSFMGLKKLVGYDTINHKVVRKIVLKYTNRIANELKEG